MVLLTQRWLFFFQHLLWISMACMSISVMLNRCISQKSTRSEWLSHWLEDKNRRHHECYLRLPGLPTIAKTFLYIVEESCSLERPSRWRKLHCISATLRPASGASVAKKNLFLFLFFFFPKCYLLPHCPYLSPATQVPGDLIWFVLREKKNQ